MIAKLWVCGRWVIGLQDGKYRVFNILTGEPTSQQYDDDSTEDDVLCSRCRLLPNMTDWPMWARSFPDEMLCDGGL